MLKININRLLQFILFLFQCNFINLIFIVYILELNDPLVISFFHSYFHILCHNKTLDSVNHS